MNNVPTVQKRRYPQKARISSICTLNNSARLYRFSIEGSLFPFIQSYITLGVCSSRNSAISAYVNPDSLIRRYSLSPVAALSILRLQFIEKPPKNEISFSFGAINCRCILAHFLRSYKHPIFLKAKHYCK